jgi:hypothetical protein
MDDKDILYHIELAYYMDDHGNVFGINSKGENPVLAWSKEDLEKLKKEDLEE